MDPLKLPRLAVLYACGLRHNHGYRDRGPIEASVGDVSAGCRHDYNHGYRDRGPIEASREPRRAVAADGAITTVTETVDPLKHLAAVDDCATCRYITTVTETVDPLKRVSVEPSVQDVQRP